jgi:hypothetical protein
MEGRRTTHSLPNQHEKAKYSGKRWKGMGMSLRLGPQLHNENKQSPALLCNNPAQARKPKVRPRISVALAIRGITTSSVIRHTLSCAVRSLVWFPQIIKLKYFHFILTRTFLAVHGASYLVFLTCSVRELLASYSTLLLAIYPPTTP